MAVTRDLPPGPLPANPAGPRPLAAAPLAPGPLSLGDFLPSFADLPPSVFLPSDIRRSAPCLRGPSFPPSSAAKPGRATQNASPTVTTVRIRHIFCIPEGKRRDDGPSDPMPLPCIRLSRSRGINPACRLRYRKNSRQIGKQGQVLLDFAIRAECAVCGDAAARRRCERKVLSRIWRPVNSAGNGLRQRSHQPVCPIFKKARSALRSTTVFFRKPHTSSASATASTRRSPTCWRRRRAGRCGRGGPGCGGARFVRA